MLSHPSEGLFRDDISITKYLSERLKINERLSKFKTGRRPPDLVNLNYAIMYLFKHAHIHIPTHTNTHMSHG